MIHRDILFCYVANSATVRCWKKSTVTWPHLAADARYATELLVLLMRSLTRLSSLSGQVFSACCDVWLYGSFNSASRRTTPSPTLRPPKRHGHATQRKAPRMRAAHFASKQTGFRKLARFGKSPGYAARVTSDRLPPYRRFRRSIFVSIISRRFGCVTSCCQLCQLVPRLICPPP
jgi:hypothetical protein